MKKPKSAATFKPFKDLRVLLEGQSFTLKPAPRNQPVHISRTRPDPAVDRQLFREAMEGVEPIVQDKYSETSAFDKSKNRSAEPEVRCDIVRRLQRLIDSGEGFVVADTPEYLEGVGPNVHPAITRYLHNGQFSIQAHIDLHGLTVTGARHALNDFLKKAITSGKRAVSIVHGRGLSSPQKPVLKTKVYEWLTSGPWRKWVIAFSSARGCDGGTGATYVLLRQRPLTKRYRKRKPCSR